MKILQRTRDDLDACQLLWTSIIHNYIFIIVESSSKRFRYSIDSHLVKVAMHFSIFFQERAYEPYREQVTDIEILYTEFILTVRRPTGESKAHPVQLWNHTQDLNWTRCFFSFGQGAKSSWIWQSSYHSSFTKIYIPIRWSDTNRKENSPALGLLCRNLLLKNTKYYANHYHLRSFDLKQDIRSSSVVGAPPGRHFGPALSALHSLNDLDLLPHA